jgi:WD repeat-containing protein 23
MDCSVMTYRGHSVLRTLIRCHFSPTETTGAQYIYSGSADGKIHIWSLDGRVVHVLDRSKTLPAKHFPSGAELSGTNITLSNTCVRDVSWHSQEPVIMSAGWESRSGGTVIARHEYMGLSKTSGALEDWVERRNLEASHTSARQSNRLFQRREQRHVPGAYEPDDEEAM